MLKRLIPSPRRPVLPLWTRRKYSVPSSNKETEGRRPSKEEINAAAIQHQLSGHAETAFRTMARFGKAAVIASVLAGLTIFGSFELAHQYVEHSSLRPDTDDEIKKYQWDVSDELYQGDPLAGGTDPGLGRTGRQAVRAAWMAQHWGVESPELCMTSVSNAVDAPILYAVAYLESALESAEKAEPSSLHPLTRAELHNRAALLLERLGSSHIAEAKAHFEQAWKGFSGEGLRAARVALKLGDVSARLNQNDEALSWWKAAVELCEGSPSAVGPLLEPKEVPTSPWAQRIIASTLVSVSAFYAQHGKLVDAQNFEESSLSFLRSIPTPESMAASSPPQALHALFLLQRSSLLSVHLAEVLHAQKKPILTSIQYLSLAATSSERPGT
ncbi:hypothetical protein NMY22_g8166 [Coprinellus aureogranulatus]|nr:hypothetical protein NMY22_g8166 [Coprinellus aureogranulatus]